MKLWNLSDVAEFLSLSETQARKATAQHDFPGRYILWLGCRPRWLDDDVAKWKAARESAGRPLVDENAQHTALYRHFDASGRLLYVGVSIRALMRLSQHRSGSGWYRQIARIELEWFETRSEALAAEAKAILNEKPRYNVHPGMLKAA